MLVNDPLIFGLSFLLVIEFRSGDCGAFRGMEPDGTVFEKVWDFSHVYIRSTSLNMINTYNTYNINNIIIINTYITCF